MSILLGRRINGRPYLVRLPTGGGGGTTADDMGVVLGLLGLDVSVAPAGPVYATSFIVTAPSTLTAGTAASVMIAPSGGAWNGQTVTPAVSGVAGAFVPTSAVGSGSSPLTFTFTASASGAGTINAAATGLTSTGGQSVTVAAAQGGGGTTPVIPGNLSVVLALTNAKSSAVAASSPVTIGHPFAPGELPAGNRVQIVGSDGSAIPVQQDEEVYWADGSLRFAALTLCPSDTFGAYQGGADTRSYTVKSEAAAPNRSAAFTTAAYMAANDHKVIFTGFDCGGETYSCSLNDILTNGVASRWEAGAVAIPSGAASGATSIVVASATSISVGQSVSTDGKTTLVSVTAISGTTITLSAGLPSAVAAGAKLYFTHPVCGYQILRSGPLGKEWKAWSYLRVVGGPNAGKYHCQVKCTLYVRSYGVNGPHEIEALVTNGNSYGNHPFGKMGPTTATAAKRFMFNATVQNGNQVLYSFGGPNDPRATTIPATNFNISDSSVSGLTLDNGTGVSFAAASGGTLPGGLSPTTGYFYVNGHVNTDRQNVSTLQPNNPAAMTSAGSGNINVYPTICVFGINGQNLATNTAEPVWDAGTSGIAVRPELMPTHDHAYLVKSKAVLPYDWTVPTTPRNTTTLHDRGVFADLGTFYPGQPQPWTDQWNISRYGDDPGDERVGYITSAGAELLYNQANKFSNMMVKTAARRFWDYTFVFHNERSGQPLAYNNGPASDGVQYPGLGIVDHTTVAGNIGNACPFQNGASVDFSGHINAYGPYVDTAHMPLVGYVPYLRTGHRIYMDQMMVLCGTQTFTYYYHYHDVNGKRYYFPLTGDGDNQLRGTAWLLRCFDQAAFLLADNDLYKPYLQTQLDEAANYLTDYYPNNIQPQALATLGMLAVGASNNQFNLYMYNFYGLVGAVCAWRDQTENRRPGFANWLNNYASRALIKLYDVDAGGGFYCGPNGNGTEAFGGNVTVGPQPPNQADWNQAFQTPAALWAYSGNGGLSSPQPAGFKDNIFGGDANYPFDTDQYFTCWGACLAMMAYANVPKAATMFNRLRTAAHTAPYAGVKWGRANSVYYDNGTPQSYLPWCVAPPGGQAL